MAVMDWNDAHCPKCAKSQDDCDCPIPQSEPIPQQNTPKREDIDRLRLHNPVVAHAFMLHVIGQLTYEQTLILCVQILVRKNKDLVDSIVTHREICNLK
jgi:hypothetical protein